MAKLERKTQKIFGGNAASDQLAAFGSMVSGTPIYTDDVETLQTAKYEQGWDSAVAGGNSPFMEEMNGVQYGLSKQIAYILQQGIPEWDEHTTYYANSSWVQIAGVFYQSLADNNTGHNPVTDNNNWKEWKFIDIATDEQAESGEAENVAVNPQQMQTAINAKIGVNKDFINQSKALETGNVSQDSDVLQDVIKYAHSMFDRSKFTVNGTSIVSGNGISQWDGVNDDYWAAQSPIKLAQLDGHSWAVQVKWINNGVTQRPADTTKVIDEALFTISGVAAYGIVENYAGTNIRFTGRFGDESDNTGTNQITVINQKWTALGYSQAPAYYIARLEFEYSSGTYTLKIKVEDEAEWQTVGTYTPTTTSKQLWGISQHGGSLISFSNNGLQNCVYNALDLKYAEIEIDGVSVFSGNKTGIDTIKADDYTVVGSPTITDVGIATSITKTNYVQTPITYADIKNKSWEFTNLVYIDPTVTGSTTPTPAYILFDNSYQTLGAIVWASGLKFVAKFGDASESTGEIYPISLGKIPEGWYYLRLSFDISSGTYTLYAKNKDTNTEYQGAYIPTTANKQLYSLNTKSETTMFRVGTTGAEATLKCDLNSFKIYVDGSLAYQACLKIPYTLSKTGSKIVSAYYRDRVQDMYEQFGYAPFYTLDEDNSNFTLPMGEVYGMIGKSTKVSYDSTTSTLYIGNMYD